jgi:hypothetical protein
MSTTDADIKAKIAETRKKLDELYLMSGYMDKYGKDVWISFIICISFTIFICYYSLINALQVVKADWPNQRCNPLFMPFAGLINKPTNQTNLEYTAENFTGCINSLVQFIAIMAFEPFRIIVAMINKTIEELIEAANKIRKVFDDIRNRSKDLFEHIYTAIANLMVAFINFVVKLKDSMAKVNGVLTSALYVLFGSYMAMESLFLSILDLVTLILIIIAAIIVVYIIVSICLFAIPIFGVALSAPTIAAAVSGAVIMIAILIPVIWFEIMMLRVLDLSVAPPPSVPSCFAGETLVPLFATGESKPIRDINLGDKLQNGGLVTATMKFSAAKQQIYTLKGVVVTGEHRVFYPEQGRWLKVKDHPESIALPKFKEPYVYCLNTTAKEFIINETLFSDWDDIDEKVWNDLKKNCVDLPAHFTLADIHTYLESGLAPHTMIKLKSGLAVPIQDVNINDILEDNTKVLGVIKVHGSIYKHTFADDSFIYGTKNIHINDSNLGRINCRHKQSGSKQSGSKQSGSKQSGNKQSGNKQSGSKQSGSKQDELMSVPMEIEDMKIDQHPVLYHLLTDTKFFIANEIKIHDYNYGIDAYLE